MRRSEHAQLEVDGGADAADGSGEAARLRRKAKERLVR